MTTNAMKSQGIIIQIGQGDGATTTAALDVFDAIGEINSFDGPGGEATVIDATHLGSAAKEKIMGLPDEGQLSLTVSLDPADAGQLSARGARASQQLKNIKIIFTDTAATTVDFKAYVLGFSVSGGVDGKVDASMNFEITGALVWS